MAAEPRISQALQAGGGGAPSGAASGAAAAAAIAAAAPATWAPAAGAPAAAPAPAAAAPAAGSVELSASRRAEISTFKGTTYVGLREFYQKVGVPSGFLQRCRPAQVLVWEVKAGRRASASPSALPYRTASGCRAPKGSACRETSSTFCGEQGAGRVPWDACVPSCWPRPLLRQPAASPVFTLLRLLRLLYVPAVCPCCRQRAPDLDRALRDRTEGFELQLSAK